MILIFDTETTGMVQWRLPVTHPSQPRVVQIGAGLYHPDGTELSAVSLLVNAGVPVEREAAAVHGIDEDLLVKGGVDPEVALHLLLALSRRATQVVCHNVSFDTMMAAIEFEREEINSESFASLPTFCTMMATTPICRIPHANGRGYKWPKLTEAYQFFFNEPLIGAHDALSDVRGCARVYFHLKHEGDRMKELCGG